MLEVEVFVFEVVAVDAGASGAVAVDEVAALYHEAFDYAVERCPFVADRFVSFSRLASAELTEVFSRLRHLVGKKLHLETPLGVPADGNVEKYNRIWHLIIKKSPDEGLEPSATSLKGWRSTD